MLDLSTLTEFNHALVYSFEPESSPRRLGGSETIEDALFPETGQHKDMLNAYLYAQESILPEIRKIGLLNITPDRLIDWVKNIHGHIGKSLFESFGMRSGEYTNELLLRWHLGSEIGHYTALYLSEFGQFNTASKFAGYLNKAVKMDFKTALDFVQLLEKIGRSDQYSIHASLMPAIDHSSKLLKGILILNKLVSAYHTNGLSSAEKDTVKKVVNICMFPDLIPESMNQWAQKTVKQLQDCNYHNLENAAEFLAKVFFELTEIHPFANANGRTATCLTNIFLRAFGYPSIILRQPGERENMNSLYQKAFAEIDSSLIPLRKLISTRVTEAQKEAFSDEKLKKLIVLRVAYSDLLQDTKSKYPDFDLQRFQNELDTTFVPQIALHIADETDACICLISAGIAQLQSRNEQLSQEKGQKRTLLSGIVHPDNKQIKDMIVGLEKISGKKGWKHSSKKELNVWIELSDVNEAEKIGKYLRSIKAAKVTVSRRIDTKVPVIKCENLNYSNIIKAAKEVVDENSIQDELKEKLTM